MTKTAVYPALRWMPLIGLAACVFISIWGWRTGVLTNEDALRAYIDGCGIFGALLFILFQAVQVVVPILPGGIGCLVGVILFGPFKGFLYNYIGICAGSMLAFAIAKSCGKPLLCRLFSVKTIDKYEAWTSSGNKFTKLFAVAIFLPVAPDDFLCYLAGTTEMKWRQFVPIILLGKPFAIAMYSLCLAFIWEHIVPLIGG